jgi:S-adenosylmethionine:tRNA ribosyltransferase-isomerase
VTPADPLSQFDFDLPEAHIALRPASPRESARLLVVRGDGRLEDAHIRDLPGKLRVGDGLVFNDTRVLPAALKGVRDARDDAGRSVEVSANLVARLGDRHWLALARPGKRLHPGDRMSFGPDFSARLVAKRAGGEVELEFDRAGGALDAALDRFGAMPLPPYIARRRAADATDRETYQTRFAAGPAESVAAPTAGLHFTPALMDQLQETGIKQEFVRLTVGLGTFAPLRAAQIAAGRLHGEYCAVEAGVADRINALRQAGGRCIAVGTTAMRTLESAALAAGGIGPWAAETDIFIRPGDPIRITDGLLTNFHLPRSSLFMLVCALMGTVVMQAAYAHAIREDYRFYSYGDACLLLP